MTSASSCIFCNIISNNNTSTQLLHTDDKVVAFQDINPSAFKHYLVIPVDHIATVKNLQRRTQDYSLVSHMLDVGQMLLTRDAPNSTHYRSAHFVSSSYNIVTFFLLLLMVNTFQSNKSANNQFNLSKHHFRWKRVKYSSLGPLGGFIEARKLLERLKP
nr:bifunctional adenosine 5'-phosphosulfate phosphorylase/adenylylsulfatase HINT4 [Tanacetum cinerariifolium]